MNTQKAQRHLQRASELLSFGSPNAFGDSRYTYNGETWEQLWIKHPNGFALEWEPQKNNGGGGKNFTPGNKEDHEERERKTFDLLRKSIHLVRKQKMTVFPR